MNATPRTLQQRIKFDYGLPIGKSLVTFTLGDLARDAMVEICENGRVYMFAKPTPGDIYVSWTRVDGDKTIQAAGRLEVWPFRNREFMAQFQGPAVASIPVRVGA